MKFSSLILTLMFLFLNCNRNQNACDTNIKEWIKEAPVSLEEFLLVKQEILSNKAFIDSISVRESLFIYTNTVDLAELEYFKMPLLKKWFKKGRGYINFKNGDTTACFRVCSSNSHGYIKLGPFDHKLYNSEVEIIDSIKLRDNWYAEVIKCDDCGS